VGEIVDGRLLQAKGKHYSLAELFGGPAAEQDARRFTGGSFVTIYLAPHNYHRIHAPLGGAITGYINVPGTLWPVNAIGVRNVDRLFCVNERLTTFLDTPRSACAVVAVGATIVGRIHAYYDPSIPVSNLPRARPVSRDYAEPLPVVKGQELGAFEMGSTVILLFEPGRATLRDDLVEDARVRVGEPIGRGTASR
jgi:phosphatidylserine decarboxylase